MQGLRVFPLIFMPTHMQFVSVTPARTELLMFDHKEPVSLKPTCNCPQPLELKITAAALLAVEQQPCSTRAWGSTALFPKYFSICI